MPQPNDRRRSRRNRINNRKGDRSIRFEGLELRQLFAAGALELPANLADKINPRAWSVAADALVGKENPLAKSGTARFDNLGMMQVYVRTSDVIAAKQQLRTVGARLDGSSREMGVVQAWINPAMLDDAGLLAAVQNVTLPDYAIRNVTSAGDAIHQADKVRAQFAAAGGVDGTGIKIGVISDGANHRANVGAELPAVTVDPSHPGAGDEGTAMLEIVHDLAPGAQLYFAGVTTSLDMVNCMTYLQNQGCQVVVDDLLFPGEHYFSDGAIASKAQQMVGAGITYVTSAGNFADDQHYQGMYVQSNSAFGGGRLHRFSISPVDDANNVSIPAGQTFRAFLQWSDAWGTSANDYDLYLYNSNTFDQLDASLSIQNGNDQPIEWVQWTNNTGSNVQAEIWVVKKDSAAARELEMFTIGNSSMQFETDGDALVGQEAIPGVISVAAANAASPTSVTAYSSRGGSTIYTNFATQTKTVRQTLDGTAIDGVNTKVGQMGYFYDPFYGTSAAAPHAAAIAALVKQTKPTATPAQVAQFMADTAIDLGAAGYDTTSGAGRYDALGAVFKAYTPAAVDLATASDTGSNFFDNITNDSTPTFIGTVPAASYSITTPLLGHGTHAVTIRVAASNAVPAANQSSASAPLNVNIDLLAPTLTTAMFEYETQHRLAFDFSENVAESLVFDDIAVNNLTTNQTIDPLGFALTYDGPTHTARWTYNGILPDGDYAATIAAGNVADIAGNTLAAPANLDFFFLQGDANHNRSANLQDFNIVAANFGGTNKTFSQGDFNYDGNVNLQDFNVLASRFGNTLAAPAGPNGGASQSTFGDSRIGDDLEDLMA